MDHLDKLHIDEHPGVGETKADEARNEERKDAWLILGVCAPGGPYMPKILFAWVQVCFTWIFKALQCF